MKKLISIIMVAGMFSLVACGPSAEELAAKEQARLDSIAKVEAELAEIARLDSIATVELEKARLDSIAKAEADAAAAAAAAKGKGSTSKPKEKAPEKVVEPVKGNTTGAGGRR